MIVTLSCAARRSAAELGIPEPVVKQARQRPYREDAQHPRFHVAYVHIEERKLDLRLNCCHHDHGQIVSLGLA